MDKWEYQITKDAIEHREEVIECGMEGDCFVHDPIEEDLLKILNSRGEEGWELVYMGYHLGELMAIWKRKKE
ncbi:MAG: hypothetical protein SVM80_01660 [Halobacteriota archaeon]|nr:hypothetical protein [Halobacteriota archaeon]